MGKTRRSFLQQGIVGAAVASAATVRASSAVNERVRLGVIGPGGMGSAHIRQLVQRSDAEVAWVCDVDSQRAGNASETVSDATGRSPQSTADLRKILDDDSIDAVFIATPDHWHVPAAIMSLDAGKHVYVEKPCCHNFREGLLLQEAVTRSGKHLQVGTQSRSADFLQEGIQRIHEGEIGEVLVAKAWNSQRRGSIGKRQPEAPPAYIDFNTWLGPSPERSYQSNLLHANWRWWYDFGCGDMGNDGIHDIDVALWGLGIQHLPSKLSCIGGKYFFDDDQQFPDTQTAIVEYSGEQSRSPRQLIFEQRIWNPYKLHGYENGQAFFGTKGYVIMGHTKGWRLYGERDRLIAERTGKLNIEPHHDNFLACVRGNASSTNADVIAGTQSAAVVHLANISARTGRTLGFDSAANVVQDDDQSTAMLGRRYRDHWSTPAA